MTEKRQVSFGLDLGALREISRRDYLIRFAAGAATSLVSALIGTFVSARASGPFLAFPAIYIAGLTLVEQKDGEGDARSIARGAIAGGFALALFAVTVDLLTAEMHWSLALLGGLAVWLVVTAGLYAGARLTRGLAPPRGAGGPKRGAKIHADGAISPLPGARGSAPDAQLRAPAGSRPRAGR